VLMEGSEYPIEPHPDSFFEWLYCRALKQFPEKAAQLSRYNGSVVWTASWTARIFCRLLPFIHVNVTGCSLQ